jgi:hypothetical protein
MGKHRAISQHSLRGRTLIGGVLASGVLLAGAPAATALAAPASPSNHSFNIPGGAKTNSVTANPAREARELASKVALVTALQNSKLGQKVFSELSPAQKVKIGLAINKWLARG